jgi:hypothetical protein
MQRLSHATRYLRQLIPYELKSPEIAMSKLLTIYNVFVGQTVPEGNNGGGGVRKNPVGPNFDLGRNGAFKGTKLLIGVLVREGEVRTSDPRSCDNPVVFLNKVRYVM